MYEQLNNLYKYYENKYDSVSLSTITPSVFGNDSFYMQLAKRKRQVDSSSRCDISKYLNTDYCSYLSPNEVKKFDIMNWQKSHESTFSVLSKMACDLLTPPVSTIASKSSFSIATNIIGDRSTTFVAEMLEALTSLKDWENGHIGLQTLKDELQKNLKKFDFNTNNDVKEIDDN